MVPFRVCLLFLVVSLVVGVYSSTVNESEIAVDEGLVDEVVAQEDPDVPSAGPDANASFPPLITLPLGPNE